MNYNNYWGFFSHTTDIDLLSQNLRNLYGINCDQVDLSPDLAKILEKALELCDHLGSKSKVTDADFFGINYSPKDTGIMYYVTTDALFHIRKQTANNNYHSSLNKFINSVADFFDFDNATKETSNLSKDMNRDFMMSSYAPLLGISHSSSNSNYQIPVFMDRLLFVLLTTVKKSPYQKDEKQPPSFSTLNTFFNKKGVYSKIRNIYPDDQGNQYIASYLMDRLFDFDTVTYLVDALEKLELQILPEKTIPYFLPMFFVPNTFGKLAYCNYFFKVLQKRIPFLQLETAVEELEREVSQLNYKISPPKRKVAKLKEAVSKFENLVLNFKQISRSLTPEIWQLNQTVLTLQKDMQESEGTTTQVKTMTPKLKEAVQLLNSYISGGHAEVSIPFDDWKKPEDTIAYSKPGLRPIQEEEINLYKCKQYLLFLSTVYLPVVNTCFYVLLNKVFPSLEQADAILMDYLNQQNFDSKYSKATKENQRKFNSFSGDQKRIFVEFYSQIKKQLMEEEKRKNWEFAISIDYTCSGAPYQKAILTAAMKIKLDGDSTIPQN